MSEFKKTGGYGEPVYRTLDMLGMISRIIGKPASPVIKQKPMLFRTRQNVEPTYSRGWVKRLFYIPDRQWLWALNAFRAAATLHKNEHYDVVLTSSPPESSHIAGMLLKKWCHIPWVADMRDGWMFEPYLYFRSLRGFRRWLECEIERFLLSKADAITAVTQPIIDDLISRLKVTHYKAAIIPNGFDPEEWYTMNEGAYGRKSFLSYEKGKMCIVHVGRLSEARGDRKADHFFRALYELKKANPTLSDELSVFLVGVERGAEVDMIRSLSLNDIVHSHHYVPKSEAATIMRDADVLLLVTSVGQKSIATSKLFDYMAAERPVMALADANAAAEIVRQAGIGLCVNPMKTNEIKDALLNFMKWWKQDNYPFRRNEDIIRNFSRRNQAEEMVKILSAVAK